MAIDLKSFYASVECRERNLDPLTTNLVVADASRTEKTICLAVSPSLKAYGIPGRARLFEVVQKMREVNRERASRLGRGRHLRVSPSLPPSLPQILTLKRHILRHLREWRITWSTAQGYIRYILSILHLRTYMCIRLMRL